MGSQARPSGRGCQITDRGAAPGRTVPAGPGRSIGRTHAKLHPGRNRPALRLPEAAAGDSAAGGAAGWGPV
jgi:hypothetical protein